MRGTKARMIRKILGYKRDPDNVLTGKRRLYRVAKKIYKQFGVLPKVQKEG